jgi:hypothetical protein
MKIIYSVVRVHTKTLKYKLGSLYNRTLNNFSVICNRLVPKSRKNASDPVKRTFFVTPQRHIFRSETITVLSVTSSQLILTSGLYL